ncbi:MAG: helix-turn-helix domain-containing protein [Chitinispirillia bacterium]|nr:helix-turn-helix domain-containing protein [Chitinispirillia bacterium]
MSNKKETDVSSAQTEQEDRVGDILRKERITRRITVETIAKDLKLNVGYIKALESSEYESLPAEPYIRVYLKSLTKYLSLDSESILLQFHKERGITAGSELRKDNRIEISMRKQEEKKSPTLVITGLLIAVLALFAFIANEKGWISHPEEIVLEDKAESIVPISVDASDDSLIAAMNTPEEYRDTTVVRRLSPRP